MYSCKAIILISALILTFGIGAAPTLATSDTGIDVNNSADVSVNNSFYEVSLIGAARQFSVRTSTRHPAGSGLNVIYHQDSSFFTLRAYNTDQSFTDYTQNNPNNWGSNSGVVSQAKQLVVKSAKKFDDGFRIIYQTPTTASHNLQVIQDVRLEGSSERTSSVRVTSRVTRLGKKTQRVAIRYLWDFEIGKDDGPALVVGDQSPVEVEKVYDNPDFKYFVMQDNDFNDGTPKFRVRGTVDLDKAGPYFTKPTRLIHACWETAKFAAFDYAVAPPTGSTTNRKVSKSDESCDTSGTGGDNAMLYYFGHDFTTAQTINIEQTKIFTAYLAKELVVTSNFSRTDSDGDALYDAWETQGVDLNNDGTPEVPLADLPGADPQKKNIYIYYDWVGANNEPEQEALNRVVSAFNDFGSIKVHFKKGRRVETVEGQPIDADIGVKDANGVYQWEEFAKIKAEYFPTRFWPVYRYMLVADDYAGTGSSGRARGIKSSDFMVTVGGWNKTGEEKLRILANTIMHELGHTLNLRHGGMDNENRKPNYLSVMNYFFQLGGIPYLEGGQTRRKLDYASKLLGTMDETQLSEADGMPGTSAASNSAASTTASGVVAQTKHFCTDRSVKTVSIGGSIDWNCDSSIAPAGDTVRVNTNNENGLDTLRTQSDWDKLVFDGGAIGQMGAVLDLPTHSDLKHTLEPTLEEHEALKRGEFIDNSERFHLLKNGSFERPVEVGQTQASLVFRSQSENKLETWQVVNPSSGSIALMDRRHQASLETAVGDRYVTLQGPGTALTQTVATEPGATYSLSFELLDTEKAGAAKKLELHLNDVEKGRFGLDSSQQAAGEWVPFVATFVADSTQTAIKFSADMPANSLAGPSLDNIHLIYVTGPNPNNPVTSNPETSDPRGEPTSPRQQVITAAQCLEVMRDLHREYDDYFGRVRLAEGTLERYCHEENIWTENFEASLECLQLGIAEIPHTLGEIFEFRGGGRPVAFEDLLSLCHIKSDTGRGSSEPELFACFLEHLYSDYSYSEAISECRGALGIE